MGGGGAERVVSILSREFTKAGHQVTIALLGPGKPKSYYQIDDRVRLETLLPFHSDHSKAPVQNKFLFTKIYDWTKRTLLIRKYFQSKNFTHVISFTRPINLHAILASFNLPNKLLICERNFPDRFGRSKFLRNLLPFLLYRWADKLIVQTDLINKEYSYLNNTVVIENPVLPAAQVEQDYAQITRIFCIGRLVHQKGYDHLLRQMPTVLKKFPYLRLEIFGIGPLQKELKELCSRYGIEKSVEFKGQVSPIAKAHAGGGIYLLPSRFEGFPNALAEAMAAGLPVISHDCPTGPETMIKDGHNGILADHKSPDSLSLNLERLITNPDLCRKIAQAASEISQEFSTENIVAKWNSIL